MNGVDCRLAGASWVRASAIASTELTLIAVGTPFGEERIDLGQIRSAAEAIGHELAKKDGHYERAPAAEIGITAGERTVDIRAGMDGTFTVDVPLPEGEATVEVVEQTPSKTSLTFWDGRAVDLLNNLLDARIRLIELAGGGQAPVAVAADHRDDARGEVAETVGEFGLVAGGEVLPRERAVLTERDRAQEVVAERVGAEYVGDLRRSNAGQLRLRHLLAADEQPPVTEDAPRGRQARCVLASG